MEKTLKEMIKETGLKMTVVHGAVENPEFKDFDGWTVTIKNGKKNMTVPFYMGSGHHGKEPTIETVLECLIGDTNCITGAKDFEDFCSNLGYDTDSRRAEKVYKSCKRIKIKLENLLDEKLEDFLMAEI